MEIKTFTVADLKTALVSEDFWLTKTLPITKHRALSYCRNPRAEADDPVLLVAYQDNRVIGYLENPYKVMFQHQDADLEPGLTVDDLRRTFHGMEKTITPDAEVTVNSLMLEQVRPDGEMREYLEDGGEPAVR